MQTAALPGLPPALVGGLPMLTLLDALRRHKNQNTDLKELFHTMRNIVPEGPDSSRRVCLCGTRAYASVPPATALTKSFVLDELARLLAAAFRNAGAKRRRLVRIYPKNKKSRRFLSNRDSEALDFLPTPSTQLTYRTPPFHLLCLRSASLDIGRRTSHSSEACNPCILWAFAKLRPFRPTWKDFGAAIILYLCLVYISYYRIIL